MPCAVPESGNAAARRTGLRVFSWLVARRVEAIALPAILLLSAGLRVLLLDREGYGNTYYAAAVWSMLQNWRAFLFASFDAGGFVTVDKPPVGLWVQALSAKLLGFSGPALLLPQALAGVGSVALVWWLIRRAFGAWAGLVAATALAVMPINVVIDRNNTMDSQLVLVLLLAAWAVSRAAESGRSRPLLVAAALVGLGFNIKMFQAYPVVPAFGLAYGLFAPVPGRTRAARLGLATVVLLAVSLSWSLVVDLIPATARPYVGSSGSNSALSLALGYNGLSRLTLAIADQVPVLSFLGASIDLTVAPAFAPGLGDPSLLRLFSPGLAGQASWLLALALMGLAVATWQAVTPPQRVADSGIPPALRRQRIALVLWGGWLLSWGAVFSFARFYHLYYLAMLGPAIAALAGIGLVVLWRTYWQSSRQSRVRPWGWLLPVAIAGTAVLQAQLLATYPAWNVWLTPLALAAALASAAILVLLRLMAGRQGRVVSGAMTAGAASLFIAPLVWSGFSVQNGNGGAWLPEAGPRTAFAGFQRPRQGPFRAALGRQNPGIPAGSIGTLPDGGGAFAGLPNGGGFSGRGGAAFGAFTFAGSQWNILDPGLLRYLEAHQEETQYLVATETSSYASVFILATGRSAMALGGYQGWDRILQPGDLPGLVANRLVRFFYLASSEARGGFTQARNTTTSLASWVRASCTPISPSVWQTQGHPSSLEQGMQLYDCAST